MTTYLPRSAWTPTSASGSGLTGASLRGVSVHWPGTTQDRIGDPGPAGIAQRLRHYRDFQLSRGWQDIGYNLAIDQAGRVWMLRSTLFHGNLVGAHSASQGNPDANREYVGVLLLLGDQEPLSDAMIGAFRDWYQVVFLPRWPNRRDVRGHGQVEGAGTECPGPFARAVMGELTTPNQEDDMTPEEVRAAVWGALHLDPITGEQATMVRIVERIRKDANTAANPDVEAFAAAIVERLDGTADAATIRAIIHDELGKLGLTLAP